MLKNKTDLRKKKPLRCTSGVTPILVQICANLFFIMVLKQNVTEKLITRCYLTAENDIVMAAKF